jgi:hypothetical protein
MSYRKSRKRRRSEAFPADEEVEGEATIQTPKGTQQSSENGEESGKANSEELRKEVEIWDAFREEHFEGEPSNDSLLVQTLIFY